MEGKISKGLRQPTPTDPAYKYTSCSRPPLVHDVLPRRRIQVQSDQRPFGHELFSR